jgi:hypothetical protein
MRWILPLLLAVIGSGACLAQSINAGDIRGSVTDPTGALVPGVTVTAMNVDTGVAKDFTTNQDGLYDTNSIVPGHYTLTFTKEGFEQLVRGPITLEVGFTTVNGQLKVGSTKQQVTVTSDVPLLTTETGEQSTTLDARTMDELPQVTQDWENFVILLPGATGCSGNNCSQGNANPGQVASINGNLPYSNILADGASTTLSHSMNSNPTTFENVAELQINTSAFSAQYGIGGVIFNQITKGGTNVWHGTSYDFIQNNILAAAPYSFGSGLVPLLRYNDFGGSADGPIPGIKRAFFYFNYDQIVDHGAGSVSTSSVPDGNILGGDFSEIASTTTLYDPTTQTIAMDVNGNPYPVRKSFESEYGKNAVPQAMLDKVAAGVNQLWPTTASHIPNGKFQTGGIGPHGEPINNFVSDTPSSSPFRKYFGRMDYDITKNNRLTMSDTQSDTPQIYPSAIAACPAGCQSGDVDNNNSQITDVWTISPHVVNEVRMGYTAQLNFFADLALGKGYASKIGWQFGKADDFPAANFADGDWDYAWLDPSSNAVYKEHVYDPSDVVTMIKGKHILHFGGEMLVYHDNSTAWGNTNAGSFDFGSPGWGINHAYTAHWTADPVKGASPDNGTGWAYADYLLGYAANWSAGVTPEYGGRLKSPQFFAQDDFKIRPTLTLNLGLRYQITHGWGETHGNLDSFDPTVMNPATNTLGAEWYGSTHANGRTNLETDVNNVFLPRVGFSWLVDAKTTLRGGYGLYAYNMSLDTYGGGMGGPFGASGNAQDTTGISPIVKLDGAGTEIMPGGVGYTGIGVTGAALPYTSASTDPARFNGSSVGYTAYHTPVPRINQWNLAVEREVATNMVVSLSYVASHAFNLVFPANLNQIPQSAILPNKVNTAAIPYPQYGQNAINGNVDQAYSNYNSLQAEVTKRMSKGVSFNFNYVWSHFMDEQDSSGWGNREGPQQVQSSYNLRANYGPSNFDVRDAFKGNVVYQLPFGKGKMLLNNNRALDEIVGGWQASGTIVLSTGNPFNLQSSQNTYANGSGEFPDRTPGVALYPSKRTIDTWFNPGAFTRPLDGTYGNAGRNPLYGPGLEIVNLSAHKDFELLEAWQHTFKFEFRADASNAFNHPSFAPPNNTLTGDGGPGTPYTSTTGGARQINSITEGGRDLQLGLRLTF